MINAWISFLDWLNNLQYYVVPVFCIGVIFGYIARKLEAK